jgi:hypothetical protein
LIPCSVNETLYRPLHETSSSPSELFSVAESEITSIWVTKYVSLKWILYVSKGMAHIKMINEYQYLQYGSDIVAYCNQSVRYFVRDPFMWRGKMKITKCTGQITGVTRSTVHTWTMPFRLFTYNNNNGYSALGPVWAGTRAQSGDWYGSGTLHSGQVLRGSLPLLSPIFTYIKYK